MLLFASSLKSQCHFVVANAAFPHAHNSYGQSTLPLRLHGLLAAGGLRRQAGEPRSCDSDAPKAKAERSR